jgi:hypothetical protein
MKVLKSGYEIEPSELSKIRGGACACGCGIGFHGENLNVGGDEGGTCRCGCFGTGAATYDTWDGARRYIN